MEPAAGPSPLAPAAFAYAAACVLVLGILPHIQAPLEAFGARHPGLVLLGRDPIQGLLWGALAGGALCGGGQALTRWTPWGRRLTRLLGRLVGSLHPADALLLAALSSFAEELLFRGVLLPYTGLAVSSALFGLAHLIPRSGLWPWAVWAAGAGLAFGWLAQATGGILAPAVAHFFVNAVGLLLLSERPA